MVRTHVHTASSARCFSSSHVNAKVTSSDSNHSTSLRPEMKYVKRIRESVPDIDEDNFDSEDETDEDEGCIVLKHSLASETRTIRVQMNGHVLVDLHFPVATTVTDVIHNIQELLGDGCDNDRLRVWGDLEDADGNFVACAETSESSSPIEIGKATAEFQESSEVTAENGTPETGLLFFQVQWSSSNIQFFVLDTRIPPAVQVFLAVRKLFSPAIYCDDLSLGCNNDEFGNSFGDRLISLPRRWWACVIVTIHAVLEASAGLPTAERRIQVISKFTKLARQASNEEESRTRRQRDHARALSVWNYNYIRCSAAAERLRSRSTTSLATKRSVTWATPSLDDHLSDTGFSEIFAADATQDLDATYCACDVDY
jgi:hypothetical protein